jgi:hypothetical protein
MPTTVRRQLDEEQDDTIEAHDEIDEVLITLRSLLQHVGSPIVRVCLEEAHNDIAHLTNREGLPETQDQPDAA